MPDDTPFYRFNRSLVLSPPGVDADFQFVRRTQPLVVPLWMDCTEDVITTVILEQEHVIVELKLRALEDSVGAVFPKEALTRMVVLSGDSIYLTEFPDGRFRLTPFDPDFTDTMEIAEKGMHRYRNALRVLAK